MQAWAVVLGGTAGAGRIQCARAPGARGQILPPHGKALEAWAKESPEKDSQPRQFLLFDLRQVTSPLGPLFSAAQQERGSVLTGQ